VDEALPLFLLLVTNSIPVALPAMYTVSTALGGIELAKRGVLLRNLQALEAVAMMNVLFLDKTGTLTINKMAIADIFVHPILEDITSVDDLLFHASLASNASNADPIDDAIISATKYKSASIKRQFYPFDALNHRYTKAEILSEGASYTVVKGPVEEVISLVKTDECRVLIEKANEFAAKGWRCIAVASNAVNPYQMRVQGLIALQDPVKDDSRQLIDDLKILGIRPIMLTGDSAVIASYISSQVGLGNLLFSNEDQNLIADESLWEDLKEYDIFAKMKPFDKHYIVSEYRKNGFIVGM
jgi:H+-transporting ATPase